MTRVGVVGAGGIGHTHLRAYTAAGVPAVAVTDVDSERAASAAEEFGATAYPDLSTMLAEANLDAVSICTPPASHHKASLEALKAGVAVLCEKPMALSEAECAEMAAAADAAGVPLSVGFCHRFQPHIEAMRAALTDGAIGTVLSFRNRFAGHLAGVENTWFANPDIAGGGVLMDTCVHSVDLFRYLIGEVADIRALHATTGSPLGPALSVEDTAVLALRSTNGVLGVIEASWRTRPGEAVVSVRGTDGTLHLDYGTMALTLSTPDGSAPQPIEVPEGDRFTRQAAHFLAYVAGEVQPRVTAADGTAAVAILAAAYESARP